MLVLKAQGSIRKRAEFVIKVCIDGAGEDHVVPLDRLIGEDCFVVGLEAEFQLVATGFDDVLEKHVVAMFGQALVLIVEVAVVAIGPDGDAIANRGTQLSGVALPLLESIALEEHLIPLASNLAQDGLFGIGDGLEIDPLLGQPGFHFPSGRLTPNILLESLEIDREAPVTSVAVNLHLVITRDPLRELREVGENFVGIRAKIMRPVGMDEHAVLVVAIMCIAPNVIALIDHQATLAVLGAESFSGDEAGETGTDD